MSNKRKALGRALEDRVVEKAKELGLEARVQPGSGVFKAYPHDAVIEHMLVECKVRATHLDAGGRRIISLDLNWLTKTLEDAEKAGFKGAVLIVNAKGGVHLLC
jgi:hypothetical protein